MYIYICVCIYVCIYIYVYSYICKCTTLNSGGFGYVLIPHLNVDLQVPAYRRVTQTQSDISLTTNLCSGNTRRERKTQRKRLRGREKETAVRQTMCWETAVAPASASRCCPPARIPFVVPFRCDPNPVGLLAGHSLRSCHVNIRCCNPDQDAATLTRVGFHQSSYFRAAF